MGVTVGERRYPPQLPAVHEAWLPREHSLHRPRHGGRQRVALLSALIFFVAPTLSWALGAKPAEIENRPLAKAPSLADGWRLFTDLPRWATDHLVFRGAAVQAVDGVSRGLFGEPAPFDHGSKDDSLVGPVAPDPSANDPRSAAGYPTVIRGKNGWLYFGQDVENKCNPVRPLDETFANLRKLRDAVESSGRKFVLIVPPDKTTMVPEYLPDTYAGRDCAHRASDEFWRRLSAEPGVVDMREALKQAAPAIRRPVYQQLDTHWTGEGGVMLARALAEAVQPGVTNTWKATPTQIFSGPGDLTKMLSRPGDIKIQLYSLAPDGVHDNTRSADINFEHQVHLTSQQGPSMVTKKVGVLTDSFSATASRYLAAGFTDVTLLNYSTLGTDPASAAEMLAGQQVVTMEVVERNLAAGSPGFLNPTIIEQFRKVLADHPMR
jgi:hypothetical protein